MGLKMKTAMMVMMIVCELDKKPKRLPEIIMDVKSEKRQVVVAKTPVDLFEKLLCCFLLNN
jgi:hypothetical protein